MFDYLFDSDNSLILADNLFGTTLKQNIKDGKGFARLGIFPRLSENVQLTAEQWLVILTSNLKEQFNGVKNVLVHNSKLIIEFADTPSICAFSKIILRESKILTTIQGDCLSIAGDQITEFMLRYGKIDPLSLFSKDMLEKKDDAPERSCSLM